MSIAEKIISIAENVPKVYEAGYEKGKSEGGGGNTPDLVYYAKSIAFNGAVFPDNHQFSINIPNITSLANVFFKAVGLNKIILKGNVNGIALEMNQAFRDNSTLVEIDLTEFNTKPTNISYICLGDAKLKKISGVFDMSECTKVALPFSNCGALEEVYFAIETIKVSISFANSPKLTSESVQSIIDGLATVETEQTLTLHSDVSSALTEEQWSEILNKNWMVQ